MSGMQQTDFDVSTLGRDNKGHPSALRYWRGRCSPQYEIGESLRCRNSMDGSRLPQLAPEQASLFVCM